MKTDKKPVFRHIILIFLGVLLGFNVYLLNAKSIAGNRMPMPFGIGSAVVQSGSMEPAYHIGDLLFVKEQPGYAVGDVVVYQSGGVLVVHRVIAINGDTVITQGDANNAPDEPFSRDCIKGGVVGRIPGIGIAIDFMKTPMGILLLIGCAVALIELSFRRDMRAEQDEEARRVKLLQEEIELMKQEIEKESRKN